MATTILNKPSGLILSDTLRRVSIQTSATYVAVTLKTVSGVVIYENTLYPSQGVAVMYETHNVIEGYMRTHTASLCGFTLEVAEEGLPGVADSCSFKVLYCDNSVNIEDAFRLTDSRFLTSRMSRRVPTSFTDSVAVLMSGGEALSYEIHYTVRNIPSGELITGTIFTALQTSAVDVVRVFTINSALILGQASVQAGVVIRDLQIVSFSVSCGSRALSYYVDPALSEDACFTFRNMFNVTERIYLPCATTTNTELEQQSGIIDGTLVMYDRVLTRSYTVTTGPLSVREARTVDALLGSHAVQKINIVSGVEGAYPIVITDMSCEITDDPEEPSTVEFTWQYTDTRPVTLIDIPVRIFSSQFNICFS